PSLIDKWEIHGNIKSLPRNSAPTHLHLRCFSNGRPIANYRDLGLSGHILHEMIHGYLLSGATRSNMMEGLVAHKAHNLEVTGSNPVNGGSRIKGNTLLRLSP
ncbi:hypothetical protein Lal_00039743, partial [Lupinus albus]